MPTLKEQRNAAIALTKENLAQGCAELLEWSDTGVLPEGITRKIAKLCDFAGPRALSVAESIIQREALEFVVARSQNS